MGSSCFEPRFRATKLRPFFDGPTLVEGAYARVTAGPVKLKVGKVYRHPGRFWDNWAATPSRSGGAPP